MSTEEDRNLVDVAAEAGVYIPTLCYLKGKPCLGTCRVCSVKVNGAVVAACTVRGLGRHASRGRRTRNR